MEDFLKYEQSIWHLILIIAGCLIGFLRLEAKCRQNEKDLAQERELSDREHKDAQRDNDLIRTEMDRRCDSFKEVLDEKFTALHARDDSANKKYDDLKESIDILAVSLQSLERSFSVIAHKLELKP